MWNVCQHVTCCYTAEGCSRVMDVLKTPLLDFWMLGIIVFQVFKCVYEMWTSQQLGTDVSDLDIVIS